MAANGNLCKQSLVMPTTITAQNGKVFKQNTKIAVTGCPVTVVSHAAKKGKAVVVVRVPEAGRVSGGGIEPENGLQVPGKTAERDTRSTADDLAQAAQRSGCASASSPKAKGKKTSTAYATVYFK